MSIRELIVTQWDVNNTNTIIKTKQVIELIVTQWDVNEENGGAGNSELKELIVTQWDVNKFVYNYGFLIGQN